MALVHTAMVETSRTWGHMILEDLGRLRLYTRRLQELPDPLENPQSWEMEAKKSAAGWKQTIRQALASHVRHIQRDTLARAAEDLIFQILDAAGVPPAWDDPRHRLRQQGREDANVFTCMWRSRSFSRIRGLRTHIQRVHHSRV
eukprot:619380-Pyramimonas_sp.AAC.1